MIRVACVGAGYFSQFHIGGWARMDGVDLVGVADTDLVRAEATGQTAFADMAQMLRETGPDVLDLILPPVAQADAIRTALDHPLRAIICQKPFCMSLDQAQEMTDLAEAADIPLIIHENFRFQPWYRTIKSAMDVGAIGDVLQAGFRLRPGDGQGPDAYLSRQPYFQQMERFLVHETAVHWIDTFRYLFGPPEAVYADLRRVNPVIAGEDAGVILFDHPHGVRSVFDGNRSLDHAAENTRCTMGEGLFEGTQGTLRLLGDGSVLLRRFGAVDEDTLLPADRSGVFGGDCAYRLQRHVIDALQSGNGFENAARDYLEVVRIEAAVYLSAAEGRKIRLGS
jgi:predicted dehydrogenase